MNVEDELQYILKQSIVIELLKEHFNVDATYEYADRLLKVSPNPCDAPILHQVLAVNDSQ